MSPVLNKLIITNYFFACVITIRSL